MAAFGAITHVIYAAVIPHFCEYQKGIGTAEIVSMLSRAEKLAPTPLRSRRTEMQILLLLLSSKKHDSVQIHSAPGRAEAVLQKHQDHYRAMAANDTSTYFVPWKHLLHLCGGDCETGH